MTRVVSSEVQIPEGPEVRRCGEQLSLLLKGKRLVQATPISGKILTRGIPGGELFSSGAQVESVLVKGKVIFINLATAERRTVLVSTLGMSGWWYPASEQLDEAWRSKLVYFNGKTATVSDVITRAERYARVKLTTDTGRVVQYVDMRNFGNLTFVTEDEAVDRRHKLGVDSFDVATSRAPTAVYNFPLNRHPIGGVLLAQDVIAGVGNIYRAEILYLARVNPWQKASTLSYSEVKRVLEATRTVIDVAYDTHGTMLYPLPLLVEHGIEALELGDISGGFKRGHLVYGRKQDLFGNEVRTDPLGGRTMWWVPGLQKFPEAYK